MLCKVAKKGLAGLALGTGLLYLTFGTSAPSYVKTAFTTGRNAVRASVPVEFEIEKAKNDVAALEPEILNNLEEVARGEVEVEHLQREVASVKANLDQERSKMVALRDSIGSGELKLAGHVKFTVDECKAELANRMDHFKRVQGILADKEATLKARVQAVEAARVKLADMAHQKRKLATQIESIQARLQNIKATEQKNDYHFDDSALARAKQTVDELEKRLEVKARVAEMEGHFSGATLPAVEPGRDVLQEFDDQFGHQPKKGEKSL